ncbi:uncharacterized protein [Montipora foliosa]|uniref:uncharacterized protein n=1 Tax=Montipora foliosa TaxID=591990 RepID=UPI0035F133F9
MEQREGETVAQFVTRLRQVVKDCDYVDQADNQIRDQVVQRCMSHDLRQKLLEKGDTLTLEVLLKTAGSFEAVQAQLENMNSKSTTVNQVRDSSANKHHHKGKKTSGEPGNKTCYRCGNKGHFGRDPECHAKGKTCRSCGGADHFSSQCRTKEHKRRGDKKPKEMRKVRYMQAENDDEEDEYAFTVESSSQLGKVEVIVGGCVVKMVIDSGASTNIVDKGVWNDLKQQKIVCVSKKGDKKLYVYGSKEPLKVLGTFSALTKVAESEVQTEFVVIDGEGEALLGRETALQLGVLKLGVPVYTVQSKEVIMSDYKGVFDGVGKLKDYQVKLHVNPDVPPVAQPVRRTPFSLRDKVNL